MTQNNEKLALSYLEGINRGDPTPIEELFSDDARIWIAGKKMVKSELVEMLAMVKTLFVRGPEMRCKGIFSNGDKVALEMTASGDSKTGKRYENSYCVIFTFLHGKVVEFNEYLDSAPANAALF
jgi:ketosteroid isomerase-like protein